MSPPPAARALAAAGAVGIGALFGVAQPLAFLDEGCPGSAAAMVLAALPLVAFLALLAAAPATLQRLLAKRTAVRLEDGAHVAAAVVMAATLSILLGWGSLVSAALALEHAFGACALGETTPPTLDAIVQGVLVNFTLFAFPVLLYVGVVHGGGPRGVARHLRLRGEDAPRALAWGVGAALAFLIVLALAAAAVSPFLPEAVLQNDQALAIARSVTLPSAILLAVGSGVGEEVFFRGFLQPRFGNLATSTVFALAHANYGSVSEVVVVFVLSLALGYLYQKTGNLWAPIAAHFAFNFLQLLVGMYAPELSG